MKVLIAFTDQDNHNPFVKELVIGLENSGCKVCRNLNYFWNKIGEYDIVHLQWPEYLFTASRHFNNENIAVLERVLMFWKARSKIILTRHNERPNYKGFLDQYEKLYNLVYSYCDGIVHLGPYGIGEFKSRYRDDIFGTEIKHVVIPHHIYTNSYANNISQRSSRDTLNIDRSIFTVLVFGRVRYNEERKFLLQLHKSLKRKNYFLLIPSWLPTVQGSTLRSIARRMYYRYKLLKINSQKYIHVAADFIQDEEIQLYFNAADVVFIPRMTGLNSGNIPLAYYFGKVAIGPNVGNMAFELASRGNPVYDQNSLDSVIKSIDEAKQLVEQGKGLENFFEASKCRTPNIIGNRYKEFYCECLSKLL